MTEAGAQKTLRIVLGAALALVVLAAAFIGIRPGEEKVCARVVELTPAGHPYPPDEAICKRVLAAQASREWPWTFASQMRCYARAEDGYAFHDCGGELAHIHE